MTRSSPASGKLRERVGAVGLIRAHPLASGVYITNLDAEGHSQPPMDGTFNNPPKGNHVNH
jgi:hypothetical protein